MRSVRRLIFMIAAGAFVCSVLWQRASTQSSLRRITNTSEEGININPSLSGDGSLVAFESTEDVAGVGGPDSFRAIRGNLNATPIAFTQIAASRAPAPAVSQDGSRIAFASAANPLGTNADGNSEIFLYDGGTLRQITNTTPADISTRTVHGNFRPSISDDGQYIAFSSNRNLASQNSDGNLEIFVYDTSSSTFTQLTSSSGIVGFTDAKISGNAKNVAFIRDTGTSPSANRDLLLQNRTGPLVVLVLAGNAAALQLTFGRAISDDGLRVVWSAETESNSSQVFFFDGRNNQTRQLTTLGNRNTDVPLHATISGDGSRIAFATRRTFLGNSDGSVDLYSFDVPSSTFGRITSGPSNATADVVSSLNDDGSVVAFNFPRVITGVANVASANNSEIYVTGTPARPAAGTLTIVNGASFGNEPATSQAVAPDSIVVARGASLAFTTRQLHREQNGSFPLTADGTTVNVNGRPAQIFFVSPSQVNFLMPAQTEPGAAEVVVTNSDGFQSRGDIQTLLAAPGLFTFTGDGLGEGVILNADTLQQGPFDPSHNNLRLIIFTTGVRNALSVTVTAGGRALVVESVVKSPTMPGLDEIHVLVPADLRGAGTVDLEVLADGRDSNPVTVTFSGDAARDIVINEFLADPPDGSVGDANLDGTRNASQDEFIELFNSTTADIDLSGYQILTRSGTGASDVLRHTFANGTVLQSCTAMVIFGGGNPNPLNPAFGGSQVLRASTGALSLNNSSGLITLRNVTGDIVNFLAYGGSTGLPANENQSLTRSPDVAGAFALHLNASNGARVFSPGTQLTNSPFNACAPAIVRVEVTPASSSIEPGRQQQFTAKAFDALNNQVHGVIFFWEIDDPSVATIDQNGLANGVSRGTAQIRATGRSVQSPAATLVVTPPPPVLTSVTIKPSTATIGAGETQQFTAEATDQFGQDFGGATISFLSNNTSVATVNSVSPSTGNGSATATVTGRAVGSANIHATAIHGTTIVNSLGAVLTVEPRAGQLLISEFRTRGPSGAADEFIEIYNPTTSTFPIGGLRIRVSNGSGAISDRVTITAGASLGPGCHYLLANNSSAGYSGSVTPDQTYTTGITDDGGIAITGSNGTSVIDAVGIGPGSAFKEGSTLPPLSGTTDQTYERKPGGSFGNGVDTNNNAADFVLTAPGNPQSSSSTCLNTSLAELTIGKTDSPDPVVTGSDLTYTIVVTNIGVAVAQNVVVTDNLPSSVTFVSCSSSSAGVCGGLDNNRTITFASLGAGASETITLIATTNAAAGTTITNTASVRSSTAEADSSNNQSSSITTVQSPLPALSISNVSANEGQSGSTTFTFTISLSNPALAGGVTFDIATQDNTATSAGADYVAKGLSGQTISAGNTTYSFEVTVNGDTLVEPDELFLVNVTNVMGASLSDPQGEATIQNDDAALVVISQVYGAGGNTSATLRNDFIEIFNRGTSTVDLAGWSVQYTSATGTTWQVTPLCPAGSCLLLPGTYFLIQQASGGSNGGSLPRADVTGSTAMAATAGKVALVSSSTALTGTGCPIGPTVLDFVSYGTAPTCFEGASGAAAPSSTNADVRKGGGCVDTNDNASDFFLHSPSPRNNGFPTNTCSGQVVDLSVNAVAVTESDSGTVAATFTVTLHGTSVLPVTVEYSTADDTATAPDDYTAIAPTQLVFDPGETTKTITVQVKGDTLDEPDETFFINLSNATNAALLDNQGRATIIDNDVPPFLTITDVSVDEGHSGTTTFAFIVHLSAPALTGGVTFDIATADGTAQDDNPGIEDNDYLAQRMTGQTIPAGSQDFIFNVSVNGDSNIEPHETFFVNLTNVTGAIVSDAQGLATIQNDDSPALSIGDATANEGNAGPTIFTFTVTSSLPAPAGGITFDIATADGTAQDDNPASEDSDYVAQILTGQTIPEGTTTYTFQVMVNGDTKNEAACETFLVNITNATNATVFDGQAQGAITDEDGTKLVISQIYGGGGNTGATFSNDFIEIFNRGNTAVSLNGMSVQYAGATSSTGSFSVTTLPNVTLQPGQYFLVQQAGGANGSPLPTPNATGSINLAAGAGKVALVNSTTALSAVGCPAGATIIDFVGYGTTANCREGASTAANAPGPANNATSTQRDLSGCQDVNVNQQDFATAAVSPRNMATTLNTCSCSNSFSSMLISPFHQTNLLEMESTLWSAAARRRFVSFSIRGGGIS